ncbi:MAG: S26 family signal peptidase [Planctomycetota bacterium]|jgi:hypothetical protein
MDISFNQIVHSLVGLIKYAVALVVLVVLVKFVLPVWWGRTCYLDTEDLGMRQALGKTTMKIRYDAVSWDEDEIQRGDIVILVREKAGTAENPEVRQYPFRVVAVGGDLIESRRGIYKVNGKLEEYPGIKLVHEGAIKIDRQRVPRGHYYILPDDRRDNRGGLPMLTPAWQVVGKVKKL